MWMCVRQLHTKPFEMVGWLNSNTHAKTFPLAKYLPMSHFVYYVVEILIRPLERKKSKQQHRHNSETKWPTHWNVCDDDSTTLQFHYAFEYTLFAWMSVQVLNVVSIHLFCVFFFLFLFGMDNYRKNNKICTQAISVADWQHPFCLLWNSKQKCGRELVVQNRYNWPFILTFTTLLKNCN